MPEFRLQFPLEQVPEYAARYSYEDDVEVLARQAWKLLSSAYRRRQRRRFSTA